MKVLFVNADDTSRHVSSANTAIYPNLGLLTLMSSLVQRVPRQEVGYLDGTVFGNAVLGEVVEKNAASLNVICFSALTANYGASVQLARVAKEINPKIVTIFGNDHFSALANRIMEQEPLVDYGFYGNDVVEGFTRFVVDLLRKQMQALDTYPGLVYRAVGEVNYATAPQVSIDGFDVGIIQNPETPEEYDRLPFVDYSFMDATMAHSETYLRGQHVAYSFMRDRGLRSQVVDIGRGCIKFAGPREAEIPCNACDFCGIIPGQKAITQQPASPEVRLLGFTKHSQHQSLAIGETTRTVQFHPECLAVDMASRARRRETQLREEGFLTDEFSIESFVASLAETPMARLVIRNFIQYYVCA